MCTVPKYTLVHGLHFLFAQDMLGYQCLCDFVIEKKPHHFCHMLITKTLGSMELWVLVPILTLVLRITIGVPVIVWLERETSANRYHYCHARLRKLHGFFCEDAIKQPKETFN